MLPLQPLGEESHRPYGDHDDAQGSGQVDPNGWESTSNNFILSKLY
ncbi:MAG: hypothetical protein ABEH38_05995 [Flavobacteriales bacterium]